MAQVQLRGGPGGPPPPIVARVQRDRLFRALAREVSERGYAATTIGHVLNRAKVSRRTFYTLFEDKETFFLEAYREAIDDALTTVRDACEAESDPAVRIRRGARALTDLCREEPAIARLCAVEVLGAGPAGQAARAETIDRFTMLVEPPLRKLGFADGAVEIQTRTLIGIVNETIYDRLSRGDAAGLPDLVDEMVDSQLKPIAS